MTDADDFVVHATPVHRERADFIINADIAEDGSPRRFEQLWARRIADTRFELCCIPFFLYDVALGDEVQTAPAHGREYMLARVVRPSGRFVFRAWFGSSTVPGAREELTGVLSGLGRAFEWHSENLLAIDAPDEASAQALADLLAAREDTGALVYETGRS
ncbi:MAG TPA: DUF4265 domain-containing protein [Solirubrobacter sp.]|nr:DUF4265 domain-containing protein [Solirubrobacter sp.]